MRELSDGDFASDNLRLNDRTIVLFHATWCPYCKQLMPSFERFAAEAKVDVARADISDYESPLWDSFSIEAVPTAILFDNGKAVARVDSTMGNGVTPSQFLEFAEKTKSI